VAREQAAEAVGGDGLEPEWEFADAGQHVPGHLSRRRASRTTLRAPVGASWDGLCTVACWAVGT
jgi:hypothetical protein